MSGKICQEDGKVDPECFVNCQRFVLDKMDAEWVQYSSLVQKKKEILRFYVRKRYI